MPKCRSLGSRRKMLPQPHILTKLAAIRTPKPTALDSKTTLLRMCLRIVWEDLAGHTQRRSTVSQKQSQIDAKWSKSGTLRNRWIRDKCAIISIVPNNKQDTRHTHTHKLVKWIQKCSDHLNDTNAAFSWPWTLWTLWTLAGAALCGNLQLCYNVKPQKSWQLFNSANSPVQQCATCNFWSLFWNIPVSPHSFDNVWQRLPDRIVICHNCSAIDSSKDMYR